MKKTELVDIIKECINEVINKNGVITLSDDEFISKNDKEKDDFIHLCYEHNVNMVLTDKQFKMCNDNIQKHYIGYRISKCKNGLTRISDAQYFSMSKAIKDYYISACTYSLTNIPDSQFKYLNNKEKKLYVLNCIKAAPYALTKAQLQYGIDTGLVDKFKKQHHFICY